MSEEASRLQVRLNHAYLVDLVPLAHVVRHQLLDVIAVKNTRHDLDKTGNTTSFRYESGIEQEAFKRVTAFHNFFCLLFSVNLSNLLLRRLGWLNPLNDCLKDFVDTFAFLGGDVEKVLKVEVELVDKLLFCLRDVGGWQFYLVYYWDNIE